MAEGGQSLNLSCSICFEEFKIPKMLPCGHTFCCQCLSKMLDSFLSLQCPTCRKDVSLPESGNVDDFPTNFALMNFIPDHEAMGEVDNEFKCPHHEAPMEFYCTSCEKQVCAKCLLKNHKPDKHNIVTASDIASNLSCELRKLEKELQECKAEVTFLGGRIFRGHDCQQQDKERLEQAIQVTLEIEQEKLKKAGENLLNKLKKTVEDQTSTYANLKKRHETLHILSNRIEKSCKDLNQRFEQLCLSESTCEIQKVLKSIATLKDAIKSVKISCQSTPTSVGLDFARTKDNLHRPLGRLTTVPSKPIFLESTDSTKDDSSQTTGKVSTQVCYRRPMPPSVFLGHPAITTPISATLTSGITAKHPVYDAGHGPLTAQVLSQVGPYEQKQMIGERLFSIIKQSHPKLAGTITGMMLKTDNAELLHVLETPQALNAKVSEAVAVLEAHDAMYPKK